MLESNGGKNLVVRDFKAFEKLINIGSGKLAHMRNNIVTRSGVQKYICTLQMILREQT